MRELRGEYDGGRPKWMLLAPLVYRSALLERVLGVPAGFVTDLESVPRTLAPYGGPPCASAGALHDFLYQSHETTKDEADAVFGEALTVLGLDPVWVGQRQQAVSFYGHSAWDSGPMRLRMMKPDATG